MGIIGLVAGILSMDMLFWCLGSIPYYYGYVIATAAIGLFLSVGGILSDDKGRGIGIGGAAISVLTIIFGVLGLTKVFTLPAVVGIVLGDIELFGAAAVGFALLVIYIISNPETREKFMLKAGVVVTLIILAVALCSLVLSNFAEFLMFSHAKVLLMFMMAGCVILACALLFAAVRRFLKKETRKDGIAPVVIAVCLLVVPLLLSFVLMDFRPEAIAEKVITASIEDDTATLKKYSPYDLIETFDAKTRVKTKTIAPFMTEIDPQIDTEAETGEPEEFVEEDDVEELSQNEMAVKALKAKYGDDYTITLTKFSTKEFTPKQIRSKIKSAVKDSKNKWKFSAISDQKAEINGIEAGLSCVATVKISGEKGSGTAKVKMVMAVIHGQWYMLTWDFTG